MTLQGHLFSAPLQIETRMINVALIMPPETTEVNPSVALLGVMQSVLLKPSGNLNTPYLIVDGDRRVASALKYGIEQIPAIITDGTRGQIAAASAILNAARSSNPLDEARSWQTALEEGQFDSVKDLAHHVRISAQTIKKRLKLLELPEDVLAHIGISIAEGVAERIANLPAKYRQQAIEAAERKLDAGQKFTGTDLKASQTARSHDMHGSLDSLFNASPLLDVPRDPLEDLVQEVKRLAGLSNIDLPTLLRALQAEQGVDLPVPVPPSTPRPAPVAGRTTLGLRHN